MPDYAFKFKRVFLSSMCDASQSYCAPETALIESCAPGKPLWGVAPVMSWRTRRLPSTQAPHLGLDSRLDSRMRDINSSSEPTARRAAEPSKGAQEMPCWHEGSGMGGQQSWAGQAGAHCPQHSDSLPRQHPADASARLSGQVPRGGRAGDHGTLPKAAWHGLPHLRCGCNSASCACVL